MEDVRCCRRRRRRPARRAHRALLRWERALGGLVRRRRRVAPLGDEAPASCHQPGHDAGALPDRCRAAPRRGPLLDRRRLLKVERDGPDDLGLREHPGTTGAAMVLGTQVPLRGVADFLAGSGVPSTSRRCPGMGLAPTTTGMGDSWSRRSTCTNWPRLSLLARTRSAWAGGSVA